MKRFFTVCVILLGFVAGHAGEPSRGYRGFFEWSNDLYAPKVVNWLNPSEQVRETRYFTGVTTSHGYQIDRRFFVGLGAGFEHSSTAGRWIVPLFVEGRADFRLGKFTPFVDLRGGVNVGSGVCGLFSPTVGYRFSWGRKVGINVGLGMTVTGYHYDLLDVTQNELGYWDWVKIGDGSQYDAMFTFRVGIDF